MSVASEKYYMAIDLSGPCSSFSLLDAREKKIIGAKSIHLDNRNNFSFFKVFFSSLKELNVDLREITEWYVGIGPGSFTGLRIAASFVSGIIFGENNIRVKAIPSALPIAAKLDSSPGDRIAVLYYASRGEILIYGVENTDGLLVSKGNSVLAGREELLSKLKGFDHITYLNNKFITDVLPTNLSGKTKMFDVYPVELLFENKYIMPDYSLGDLIYVRPATIAS